jgi:hypothetical protein
MLGMVNKPIFVGEFRCIGMPQKWMTTTAVAVCLMVPVALWAQPESGGTDAASCTLKDHVYHCNGAAFQTMLMSAKAVSIEAHNADGVARSQLTDLLTKKLNKTIATKGGRADLIFLMVPIDPSGIVNGTGDAELGTLRVYSAETDGTRGDLVWAETYSGTQDLPWPAVVRGLILRFQSHFPIR